ncbi:MAG: hypothetical protein ACRDDL_04150 [Sarcina sp.]
MSSYKIYKILKFVSIIGVIILVSIGILGVFGKIPTNYISLLTIIVTAFVVSPIYYKRMKGID